MRRLYSLVHLQFFTLLSALIAAIAAPAFGQNSGAGGGGALQGGVSALDRAANEEGRQTVRLNLGSPATGFFDNGQTLQSSVRMEKVPPEVFRAWLTDNHNKFALSSQTMSKALVVDVAGRWDHADKTLTKFGINFTHIKTGDIRPEILSGAKVVIINCAGEVRRDRLQFIRDFVQNGGYLLTTDWALDNMLEQTFPGYVKWNNAINDKSIYSATYISPDPVLAKGCVRTAPWKLDAGAKLVRVLRPDLVRVLVVSRDLAAEDHDRAGVLACLFPFGKGYVLHMVGHFDNNASIVIGNFLPDPAPNIRISLRQALACNFIVAGLTGEPIPTVRSAQTQLQNGLQSQGQQLPQQRRGAQQWPVPMQQGSVPYQPMRQGAAPQQMPPQQGQSGMLQPGIVQQGSMQPRAVPPGMVPPGPVPTGPVPTGPVPTGPIQTAPGAMPPLAPDRLRRGL